VKNFIYLTKWLILFLLSILKRSLAFFKVKIEKNMILSSLLIKKWIPFLIYLSEFLKFCRSASKQASINLYEIKNMKMVLFVILKRSLSPPSLTFLYGLANDRRSAIVLNHESQAHKFFE